VRSEFDQMLLENARAHGVTAHEGVRVLDVDLRGDTRRRREAQGPRGAAPRSSSTPAARTGLIANRPAPARVGSDPEQGPIWSYFEGAYRDTGRDEGATMVLQTPDKQGWFWYIPQHDNIVSVGVVGPFDYLFKDAARTSRRSSTRKSSGRRPSRSASKARRASPASSRPKDYSYRTTRRPGDGWVLVGDAWGFLDPLYSSGVLLALKSGELAADAIVEG
jgi:flavin-dependent dehydrogenase